jgi:hypothetical protein
MRLMMMFDVDDTPASVQIIPTTRRGNLVPAPPPPTPSTSTFRLIINRNYWLSFFLTDCFEGRGVEIISPTSQPHLLNKFHQFLLLVRLNKTRSSESADGTPGRSNTIGFDFWFSSYRNNLIGFVIDSIKKIIWFKTLPSVNKERQLPEYWPNFKGLATFRVLGSLLILIYSVPF